MRDENDILGIRRMSLLRMNKDNIENLIEEMLDKRVRSYEYFNYFIIDDYIIVVKIYDENDKLLFTVKTTLYGNKLQIVEVS